MRVTAAVSRYAFSPACLTRKLADDPVDDLQHGREQFAMDGKEDAQRDREREHPLAHRHPRDDVIDQVGSGFCHAPGAARGAKPTPLTGKRYQLLMGAVTAARGGIRVALSN